MQMFGKATFKLQTLSCLVYTQLMTYNGPVQETHFRREDQGPVRTTQGRARSMPSIPRKLALCSSSDETISLFYLHKRLQQNGLRVSNPNHRERAPYIHILPEL